MTDLEITRLCAENQRLREALFTCREEFCWHGNTGKHLNADSYSKLVDMIDDAIKVTK